MIHEAGGISLRCQACRATVPEMSVRADCPHCGGLLALDIDVDGSAAALRDQFDRPVPGRAGAAGSGVWRYQPLVFPSPRASEIVSFAEGNTPLFESARVRRWTAATTLLLKHEGMNPTGSFKDRGMTVAMTQASRTRARAVACASTGNTSASAAAYAALAGLPCFVFVPAGAVASGKLAQTKSYGATIVAVRGDFDDALTLVREASERQGIYLVNSINPFRVAGQQAIVYELLHQLAWDAPDYIALPAGNLGNVSAFGSALRRLRQVGLIDRLPRLIAVQASGAAPFARGFAEGFTARHRVRAETIASAIRIGNPASWDRAVDAIRDTNGVVVAVSDEEILEAKTEIDRAGIGCEPASAASVAGVRRLVASGHLDTGTRGVAILTGHLLKDPEANERSEGKTIEIDASIADVERLLDRA